MLYINKTNLTFEEERNLMDKVFICFTFTLIIRLISNMAIIIVFLRKL